MVGGLNGAYFDISKELGAGVAPVGIAWKAALAADPPFVLHSQDKSHPNPTGTYLAACVFYATLLDASPVGLPGKIQHGDKVLADIPDDQAKRLQEIAWAAVKAVPRHAVRSPFLLGADISWVQEQEDQETRFFHRHQQKDTVRRECENRTAIYKVSARASAQFIEIPLHRQLGLKPPYSITKRTRKDMEWLARALADLPKPCGIVVMDDWAPNLVRACDEAKLTIPEEVAIVGLYSFRDACEYTSIPISAVDADFERIAYEGARLLDRLMRGGRVPKRPLLLPPKCVVMRQSTNVLAVEHSDVGAALRFIWDHFREPIQVTDVVKVTKLSYRGLSLAFHKHLGRTIAAEIRRKRIEEAQRLLRETPLKAWQIAERSGFSGLPHLSHVFRHIVGQSPSRYRRADRAGP